jgi:hypothetical protein
MSLTTFRRHIRKPTFRAWPAAVIAKAYWVYFQKHFADDKTRAPKPRSTTVTVRIPIGKELSAATIDYMRAVKATFMAIFAKVTHHD